LRVFPSLFLYKKKLCIFHVQEQLFSSCSAFQDALTGGLFTDMKSCLISTNKCHQLHSVWGAFSASWVRNNHMTSGLIVPEGTDSSHWNVRNYHSTLRNISEHRRSGIG
jgi:hypothetical protein